MTRELFDKAAPNWDKNTLRLRLAEGVVAAIRNAVPLGTGMRALEIGCGTGLITTALAPYLKEIVAADSSGGMLTVLRGKIDELALTNIKTAELDFRAEENLPDAGHFDLVYSSMTLHHIEDVAAALAKCRRILAPGGFLAMADLEKEDGSFHSDAGGVHHQGFVPEKLAGTAEQCGFAQVNTERIHIITKENAQKQLRDYPVFLLTARRG